MDKIFWILIVILAGAMLPVQAGLNAKVGKALESPVHASFLSFVIGAVALVLYLLVTRQPAQWQQWREVPAVAWSAGVFGAVYVTITILAFPRLGAPLTFGLIVAGQLFVALLLDHFKILVAEQHPINFYRLLGVVLIVAGVVLIRRF
ncbi:MAG: DMT family transporter [Saprospiraceae bacterium]|nr:DMT family transporter [Saprospiraceae bacterium]